MRSGGQGSALALGLHTAPDMITATRWPGGHLFRMDGELDAQTVQALAHLIDALPADAQTTVDLANTRAFPAAVLATLGSTVDALRQSGREVLLRGLTQTQLKLLRYLGCPEGDPHPPGQDRGADN